MKRKDFFSFFIFLAFFVVPFGFAHAENIDPQNAGHKYAKFLDDDSQISFDCDNNYCNVTVSSSEITGYAWGENVGWISLNCSNDNSCGSSNFKVVNDGQGNLSGEAWGENTGWVRFKSTSGNSNHKVVINSDGEFDGYAWSENYGWIQFDCDVVGACLKTSWEPSSGSSGSTSGSSSSNNNNPPPPPPVFGCTSIFATNYNPSATVNDNSCIFGVGETPPTPTPSEGETNQPTTSGGGGQSLLNLLGLGGNNQNPNDAETEDDDNLPVPNEDSEPTNENNINDNTPNFFNSLGEGISDVANQVVQGISDTLENMPTITRETMSVVSVALLAVSMATIPLRHLVDAPSRAVQLVTSAFTRKKKSWGIVFDAVTKQPLDPVVVALKDANGNVVQTSITDMEGRFGFVAPPGMYTIQANKADYIFPSKKFEGLTTDVVYDSVYLGGAFEVSSQGEIISKNIPLDPVNFNWNEFEKKRMGVGVASLRKQKISALVFILGFVGSIVAMFLLPTIWNYIILGMYIVVSILRILGLPRHSGTVKNRDGRPLAFGVMHVFSNTLNKEVKKVVLDDFGNYYCLIRNGEYYVTFEARNTDGTYSQIDVTAPFTVDRGAIKKKFVI